jgi:hypothetical protein
MKDLSQDLETLRYPIGRFQFVSNYSEKERNDYLKKIEALPKRLKNLVKNWSDEQLATPYRPDGWTVKQLIHHIADSHMNSYVRFKWTLTEDRPTIKAYYEDRWAKVQDSNETPISISLDLLTSLHQRWLILMRNLTESEWQCSFIHPETNREITLMELMPLYAWHSEHHFEHINQLKIRQGWD